MAARKLAMCVSIKAAQAPPAGRIGSDIRLIAMLNAHKPAKYRQNVVVVY